MNKTFSKAIRTGLGFTINILELKLTKTKESIQNNEITVSHF